MGRSSSALWLPLLAGLLLGPLVPSRPRIAGPEASTLQPFDAPVAPAARPLASVHALKAAPHSRLQLDRYGGQPGVGLPATLACLHLASQVAIQRVPWCADFGGALAPSLPFFPTGPPVQDQT